MDGDVILLSGGVESATLLAHAVSQGARVMPLYFDYGQRAAEREYAAAQHQCRRHRLSLMRLDISAAGEAFRARQVQKRHVPLPHRNLILLSLALAFAEEAGAATVSLALIREDAGYYPSAGPAFTEAFAGVAASLGSVTMETPFRDWTKTDVIRCGAQLGVDYAHTYSCLLGYPQHCGACPQCRKRRAAFAAAGVEEPPGFYRQR